MPIRCTPSLPFRARTAAALTMLVALTACGAQQPGTPSPTAPAGEVETTSTATSTTSSSPTSPDSGSATSSATATEVTTTPATTPSAEPSTTGTASATTADAAATTLVGTGDCSTGTYTTNGAHPGAAPVLVADLAGTLLSAAMTCDSPTLVSIAAQDQTQLNVAGDLPAEEALGLPDVESRYLALATVLSKTDPARVTWEGQQVWVWPAAAAGAPTEADWADLVAADMFTDDELAQMRDSGVYTGWRVGLSESAEWVFFLAG